MTSRIIALIKRVFGRGRNATELTYRARLYGKNFEIMMRILKEAIDKHAIQIEVIDGTKEQEAYDRGYKDGTNFSRSIICDEELNQ